MPAKGVQAQIPDDAVYDERGLQALLGLKTHTLRLARHKGEIRFSKRAQRIWYVGKDVKQWLFGNGASDG